MFSLQPLYQNDPLWKDTNLGLSVESIIGKFGCLLTSITMVANGFGSNETPASLNKEMKAANGFKGSLIVPQAINQVVPETKFAKQIKSPERHAPPPKLSVHITDAGLALRSQPVTTDLLVIKPAQRGEKTIRAANQWLKVRDIQGAEGYGAAWYVLKRPAASP